jgi:hypothetical protein
LAITHGRMSIRVYKTLSGMSIPTQDFPEAASQTFKAGALVTVVAGLLQECGPDPALIMGVATRDGQNALAGAKRQVVALAHPDTLFLATLDNGAGTRVSAATDRALQLGVAKHGGTGTWYLDSTEVTAKRVVIYDLWEGVVGGQQSALGDTSHPAIFVFDPTFSQALKA